MTPRELVVAAIEHRETTPVPSCIDFTTELQEKLFDKIVHMDLACMDLMLENPNLDGSMRKGGGYILAPAQSIQEDVPLENIEALINFVNAQQ